MNLGLQVGTCSNGLVFSRLEMTLNLSVFHYEILDAPEKALQLAKEVAPYIRVA